MVDPARPHKSPTIRTAVDAIRATQGRARQVQRAFERSPVPMVTVDGEKRYHAANSAARLVFGLSLDDWLQLRIEDLTPPHMLPILDVQRARLMRQESVAGRYDCALPDGEVTIAYIALANVLPGRHLIVFLPSNLPDDELAALIDDEVPAQPGKLSRRAAEVLTLIARGANTEQIAEELGISVPTVRTHTRNLLRKLGARHRAHAIALAMQQALISVPPLTSADDSSAE